MSDDYIDWEKAARKYNIEIGEKDATIARLTRELEEARESIRKLRSRLDIRLDYVEGVATGEADDAIDRLEAENAALREEVERLR